MNKTLRILIIGAMLLVAALAALPAGAQESAISATINRNKITTDDLLLLTVTRRPAQSASQTCHSWKASVSSAPAAARR